MGLMGWNQPAGRVSSPDLPGAADKFVFNDVIGLATSGGQTFRVWWGEIFCHHGHMLFSGLSTNRVVYFYRNKLGAEYKRKAKQDPKLKRTEVSMIILVIL